MKILTLHCDFIKFKALKKAIKTVDEIAGKQNSEGESKDCLVVMTAVEKVDSKNSVSDLVGQIKDIASQVNVKNIVLYPYAHLSKELGSPEMAIDILNETEKALKKEKFEVLKAPFGYYKEFELKVKGHPLSELSREIKGKEGEGDVEEYDSKKLLREISKSVLDKSKLKDNDHRIIAQEMDLFSFNETAPGMVFWHNNGLIIRNELIDFWREIHKKAGYQEIRTPQILDSKLWKISGHWEKYKENIFLTEYDKRIFAVKPMNCPGGMIVYKNSPKSYKDLPLRVGELGDVHRQELSGVLGGIFRVIQFTQDDAHIFCTEEQVEEELKKVIDMVKFVYDKVGLKLDHVELSTRPEKRIGSDAVWDKAEVTLEKVLKKLKMNYKINKGDGAFYGPKIDYHVKDSLGRMWQCGTIQLDFAMPERFELEYTDQHNQKKRPIMIHRTLYGSLERFLGIITEHFRGWFPTWLAPIQVRVINFTDKNTKYTEGVLLKIQEQIPGARVDIDLESESVQSKVKSASLMRIPYVLVVGDKEEKSGEIAVRTRGDKKIQSMKVDEFISRVKEEIRERK